MISLKKQIRMIFMSLVGLFFLLGLAGSAVLWFEGVSFQEIIAVLNYHRIGYIIAFLILYTIRPYTFVPSTVLMLGSVFLFEGLWMPVLLAFYGTAISLIQTYWIGRLFADDLVQHHFYKQAQEYVEKVKNNAFKVVLVGCASPFIPNDLVCYATGIVRYHFGKFMAAGLLGDLPITFLYLLIAHWFYMWLDYWAFGFSIVFALLVALYIIFHNRLPKIFRF